jgi:hypothetical protein
MPTRSDLQWLFDSSGNATVPPGPPAASPSLPASTAAEEWEQLRASFASSIMVDTALSSLAQNLDGLEWPFPGRSETPNAYLDLSYAELVGQFTERGHPEAVDLLGRILRETLAFDEPFGEMVTQAEAASERENPLLRSLARLGIGESFPLELATLDETAQQLCRLEHVATLGEFTLFAQRLSQGIIVGGDVRRLLNAIAHVDEKILAQILPFRPGTTGLHLEEALIHAARSKNSAERAEAALAWFAEEAAAWRAQAATDRSFLARRFASVDDPEVKARATALLAAHFRATGTSDSWWSRLTRWFKH